MRVPRIRAATPARARSIDGDEVRRRSARILAADTIARDPGIGRLQPLAWPVWRKPAPPMPRRPDMIAVEVWPLHWALITGQPVRALRELGRIVARSFWEAGYPCCYRHRYGHGWTRYTRIPVGRREPSVPGARDDRLGPLTAATGGPVEIPEDGLVIARDGDDLIVDLGPAPCPTCGQPPPKRERARWLAHVAQHR